MNVKSTRAEPASLVEDTVVTRSGGGSFICRDGDTILSAALRAGVGISYECNAGECGSCKVTLSAGEVIDLKPDAGGLSERERARGKILACQSIPKSACEISFREDCAAIPLIRPERVQVSLLRAEPVTHDLWEFTFQGPKAADFQPGQYALISIPGVDARRSYSMSNLPNPLGLWQFLIRRVPGGKATGVLFEEMRAGDVCMLDGPYSTAGLKRDVTREIVCIAGGSGLAPMVSIVRGVLAEPTLVDVNVHLCYGAREPRDVIDPVRFFGEFGNHGDRLQVVQAVSCEPELLGGWTGEYGFIHEVVDRRLQRRFQSCEFYLAGPPPMVEASRRLLILERQVDADRIHYDRFF